LALDGLGVGKEALNVLEVHYGEHGATSADALGVLGGCYKWRAGSQTISEIKMARKDRSY